ncbi:hypothetical protein GCM10009745_33020 [Kribbella yunnanensis]|uniref:Uncharacterized protein n=1 Tax=Kribbella yunnanensis TaxID=190194 RepID=A0ABP4TDK2_9ACTN
MAPRVAEWAVCVRLDDGGILFWCGEGATRRNSGWGRESQAYRFADRGSAEQYAAGCQINSRAKEYLVVRLPQRR